MGFRWLFLIFSLWVATGFGATEVDKLFLVNGDTLSGRIDSLAEGKVRLRTDYAGSLEIDLVSVERLVAENPLVLVLADGSKVTGQLVLERSGELWRIRQGEVTEGQMAEGLKYGYLFGQEDPVAMQQAADREKLAASETAGEAEKKQPKPQVVKAAEPARDWSFKGGVDLRGKMGNTRQFQYRVDMEIILKRPYDRFRLYGGYDYGTNRGVRNRDQTIVGIRYTNFFMEKLGWFLRQEIELDDFEGIALRSTSAGGLSYRFYRKERLDLEGRLGFSNRYEDYSDDGSNNFQGLDIGLDVDWEFAKWGRFTGSYTYIPVIEELGEYILTQDSGFVFPLGTSDLWSLRLGMSHEYNSRPENNRTELDTRYYMRLIVKLD